MVNDMLVYARGGRSDVETLSLELLREVARVLVAETAHA